MSPESSGISSAPAWGAPPPPETEPCHEPEHTVMPGVLAQSSSSQSTAPSPSLSIQSLQRSLVRSCSPPACAQ